MSTIHAIALACAALPIDPAVNSTIVSRNLRRSHLAAKEPPMIDRPDNEAFAWASWELEKIKALDTSPAGCQLAIAASSGYIYWAYNGSLESGRLPNGNFLEATTSPEDDYDVRGLAYHTNTAKVTQSQLDVYVEAAVAKEAAETDPSNMRDALESDLDTFFRNQDYALFVAEKQDDHAVIAADKSKCLLVNVTTSDLIVHVAVAAQAPQLG